MAIQTLDKLSFNLSARWRISQPENLCCFVCYDGSLYREERF